MNEAPPVVSVPADFIRAFDTRPVAVGHGLVGHPLLDLDAVARLAGRLAGDSIEHNPAQLPVLAPGGTSERGRLDTAPEVVAGIATAERWMVLWNIEQVPEYRDLLRRCLDPIAPLVPPGEGAMRQREGFVFVSSPGSVTAAHVDPEHNLLLQVAGTKRVTVGHWDSPDHARAELRRYYAGGHRNLDRLPAAGDTFELTPGTGVYVPMYRPHWVEVGDQASVSFSVTFRTARSARTEDVHAFNARLGRLGLTGRPPGRSRVRDGAKSVTLRGYDRLRTRRSQSARWAPTESSNR